MTKNNILKLLVAIAVIVLAVGGRLTYDQKQKEAEEPELAQMDISKLGPEEHKFWEQEQAEKQKEVFRRETRRAEVEAWRKRVAAQYHAPDFKSPLVPPVYRSKEMEYFIFEVQTDFQGAPERNAVFRYKEIREIATNTKKNIARFKNAVSRKDLDDRSRATSSMVGSLRYARASLIWQRDTAKDKRAAGRYQAEIDAINKEIAAAVVSMKRDRDIISTIDRRNPHNAPPPAPPSEFQ